MNEAESVEIRPVGAPEISPYWPALRKWNTFPNCVDACDEGRKLCPVPDMCNDGSLDAATGIVRIAMWIVLFYVIVASVWLFVLYL